MSAPAAGDKEYEMVGAKDVEVGGVSGAPALDENGKPILTAVINEHALPHNELEKVMGTDFKKGLTTEEAASRLVRDGPNELTPPVPVSLWWKFFLHLVGGFSLLLWVGSILCFIVYGLDGSVENLTLGLVLAIVVVATGTFSFYQDMQAEKVLAGFSKMAPTMCDVMRSGETVRIDATEIVYGDVVFFEKGMRVPVDVIILTSNGIKVDNSSLTGESLPQKCTPAYTAVAPTESRNVAFYGTNCTEGNGSGVAIRVGDATEMGKIADATQKGEKPAALMVAEIDRFVKIISVIAFSLGISFLIISVAVGYSWFESCIFTIGIIVANVPEGLLATVTLSLTITAQRMAEKMVLVKNTKTVETLGSVNVICSDKTGTLTQNNMIVRHAIFNSSKVVSTTQGRQFTNQAIIGKGGKDGKDKDDAVVHAGINSPGKAKENDTISMGGSDWQTGIHPVTAGTTVGQRAQNSMEFDNLLECGALCNHALFSPGEASKPIEKRGTTSDPSEGAILKFCHSYISVYDVREAHPEVACVPFSSAAKWMAVIVKEEKGHRVIVKGAPERIMERCSTHGKESQPLTEEIRNDIDEAIKEVAENGERAMAFGEMWLPDIAHGFEFDTDGEDSYNFPVKGMRFVGILAMEDPPRPEVPDAVRRCHEAGIKVVMVTGDHPLTARNIAAQVEIIRPRAEGGKTKAPLFNCSDPPEVRRNPAAVSVVVTGSELSKFDEEDWKYVLTREDIVFARTLPEQKQTIVANFQLMDMVVAVTGDGVNDAPALKKADVGIAMGSGSQVSHDAADMILMDDNFASIVKGIEEGRLIFVNLKKSIAYTLTSNIPEIVPFLAQIILQIPNALTTIMILCIDLGTDLLPAISFSYEKPENDIMAVPPRNRITNKLVTWQLISWSYLQIGIIQTFAAYSAYFYIFSNYGDLSSGSMLSDRQGIIWLEEDDHEDDESKCNFKNDSGDCMDFDERKKLLEHAQTAFFVSIIIMQIGCGFACKTRLSSLFTHGFSNNVLSYGMFSEVILVLFLVYAPFVNSSFGTYPLNAPEWFIAFPYAFFLVLYDENRKFWMRKLGMDHWFSQNFYF